MSMENVADKNPIIDKTIDLIIKLYPIYNTIKPQEKTNINLSWSKLNMIEGKR